MSEFGGWWKHENNQHALVAPKTENVTVQLAEELKTVTYATPPMEERRKKEKKSKPHRVTTGHTQPRYLFIYLFIGGL